ncbi:hypothetical protein QTP88_008822 [Uroleucon formosanum]
MEQFLGIHLFMSIIKMPSYRMFWSNQTRFNPFFETMSRNRFDNLRTNFHISDNDLMLPRDNPLHDKLFKIRPFISSVQNNFKKIQAEEFCAIDEIIIPFKGRSQMKQYNQNKPHKWGIKVFAIASISGFIHDFEIYVGKGTLPATRLGLGISGNVVIRLLESVPKFKNYKVATDNWFNSYNLQCHLKFSGMLGIGIVRTNRLSGCTFKNEKDIKKSGRGTFDTKVDTTNKIVATKWYDNKFVHVVSNYKGIHPLDEVERWSTAKKERVVVPRPASKFKMDIAYSLLLSGKVKPSSKRGRPSKTPSPSSKKRRLFAQRPVDEVRYDQVGHWPKPVEVSKRQQCKHCIKAYTTTSCSKCNVFLCYTLNRNCFVGFHQSS